MFYTHPNLLHPALTHGFFGRRGGVSEGIYARLNVGRGSGDAPEAVAENRARVLAALGGRELLTLYQVHSAKVVILGCHPGQPKAAPGSGHAPRDPGALAATGMTGAAEQADALVTNQRGIAIGILTADCAPVLFADVEAGVIGAAHAGWKGAHGGVLENTIDAMESLGADRARIVAVIGPTIQQPSYEVGAEFYAAFDAAAQNAFFIPSDRPDHYRFNLPGYAAHRLRAAGLRDVHDLAMDTYANEAEFFSFRRTTHAGEPDYGRQVSGICLR